MGFLCLKCELVDFLYLFFFFRLFQIFPSILSILFWVVFVEIVRSICAKDGNQCKACDAGADSLSLRIWFKS